MTTKNPHAQALGQLGGRATSEKKAASSRANGMKAGHWCRTCDTRMVEFPPKDGLQTYQCPHCAILRVVRLRRCIGCDEWRGPRETTCRACGAETERAR